MDEMYDLLSEGEKRQMEESRKRQDAISKKMGNYLLRGYKMLAAQCEKCETILLQDPNKALYCIGCSEIDRQLISSPSGDNSMVVTSSAQNNYSPLAPNHVESSIRQPCSVPADLKADVGFIRNCIVEKMMWATKQLNNSTSPQDCKVYLDLIKNCSETVLAVEKLK